MSSVGRLRSSGLKEFIVSVLKRLLHFILDHQASKSPKSLPLFSTVKLSRDSDQTCGQECQLRALLIGGGGQGDNSGGGSGHLKYINMSVADIQATKVHLFVGGPGKASTFTVPKDQTHGMEATALPGKATN